MSSSIALFEEYLLTIILLTCDFLPHVIFLYQPAFYSCVSQVLTILSPANIFVKVFIGKHRPREVETFPEPFGDLEQSQN